MPRLKINGHSVSVDDSFLSLTPEQQNAEVDEIAKSLPTPRSGTLAETADAFVRGAANAATFGFADRIAAGMGAATGIGGKFGDYSGNLEAQRGVDAANLEQHPAATLAGNVAGAFALPVGAAASAPTLGGRMAAGAGLGAAQGAAYGVGSSPDLTNLPEVAGNAGAGMATGAALGGLAPPVVEGLSLGLTGAANKTGIPQAVRGYLNPEGTAARMVGGALERDRAASVAGLDDAAFQEAVQAGQPVVNADRGGVATQRLARTASNMSEEAQSTLGNVVNDRFEAQGPRIADMVRSQGGGNSVETLDKLREAAQRANRPLYKKAYAEGANGIWTPGLQEITGAPAVQDAIRGALKTGANADIAAGFKAVRSPFSVAEDGSLQIAKKPDGSSEIPSLQFWDHVKRNLDDRIESARRAGENNAARVATALKDKLVQELDAAAPTYAQARGMAAKAFGAEDALEAGAKFVMARGKNADYAKTIASMSKPERELFAHGFLSEIENRVHEVGDRRNVIKAIFGSQASRQRVEMAVGSSRAAELQKFLYAETIMDQLRTAVQGNSTTARQLADMAAIPALIGGGTYLGGASAQDATLAGAAAAISKHGARAINARVMEKVADMLASNNPREIDRAISTIRASKPLQETLRPFASRGAAAYQANEAERRKSFSHENGRRVINIAR